MGSSTSIDKLHQDDYEEDGIKLNYMNKCSRLHKLVVTEKLLSIYR